MTRAVKPEAGISKRLPLPIEGAQHDVARARHLAADVRDAEAAFPVLDRVRPGDRDLRIDHRHQRHALLVVVLVAVGARREAGHEQADALVHLRRGQADALVLGHRLEHVVDQLLDARRLDLADVDRPRPRTQHRVAHVRNLQNRHRRIIVVQVMSDAVYRYCPTCGGPLEARTLKTGDRERMACAACGFVLYLDPKVAVGTIIRAADERLVLVRRAIEPGYGLWVFPGGYVDRGEQILDAARA